jgi:hypothetical protein
MIRIALVVAYLVSTVLAVIALDDGDGGNWQGTVWLGMAVLLGAGIRDLRLALLPLVAIPIAIPFGIPADAGDPAFPLWVGMLYLAAISAFLVAVGVLVGQFVDRRRRRRPAAIRRRG